MKKIIHFCWFGNANMGELAERCMSSWSTYAPDFEIKRWDESNFTSNTNAFAQAKRKKQWAFMSDIARLEILYSHGGVYLDVDVELVKPLDSVFAKGNLIIGFESEFIGAGVICAVPGHPLIKSLIDRLEHHSHITNEFVPIPKLITETLLNYSGSDVFIAPPEYFYPFNPFDRNRKTKQLMYSDITENTLAIHHYQGGWSLSFFDLVRSKLRALKAKFAKYLNR